MVGPTCSVDQHCLSCYSCISDLRLLSFLAAIYIISFVYLSLFFCYFSLSFFISSIFPSLLMSCATCSNLETCAELPSLSLFKLTPSHYLAIGRHMYTISLSLAHTHTCSEAGTRTHSNFHTYIGTELEKMLSGTRPLCPALPCLPMCVPLCVSLPFSMPMSFRISVSAFAYMYCCSLLLFLVLFGLCVSRYLSLSLTRTVSISIPFLSLFRALACFCSSVHFISIQLVCL